MATLVWSQCPAVESVPGKVSGAWVLRGTRMPVTAIFENLEAGANIDDILKAGRAELFRVLELLCGSHMFTTFSTCCCQFTNR